MSTLPSLRKKIHFIGIGGVGMAGLAVLLKARGHEVSGCDIRDSPRLDWLRREGVAVSVGHDPAHVAGMDAVVVTPAVRRENPEFRSAPPGRVRYRGEVLAEVVNAHPDAIAVCGSHGKTTTATWIARLLKALGEDVAWCIGGETGGFPVAGAGSGPLVVEADESDGTLALYRAKTLVVNKCEYDHPDHFKTEADYFACYETAKKGAREIIESEQLDCSMVRMLECSHDMPPHNLKNMRAAVEVALRRGHKIEDIARAIPEIVAELPDRRFQIVYPNPLTVVTDYAHHPTEMRCAVEMARAKCKGTLRVLFQPHRYSRTKALLADFPAAFEGADEVVLCPTYAAFEKPVEGGDVADLYRVCRENLNTEAQRHGGCRLYLARSCEEAWEHALNSMKDGDLTLLLGAGDIINLVPRVQSDLNTQLPTTQPAGLKDLGLKTQDLGSLANHDRHPPTPKRLFIGAGSNTWKSDLRLNVEYVKTDGPAGAPGASLGIPWMAGIPGTIGGWIKMNAGAFGHSISEVIEKVKVDGKWLSAVECGFAYRHSDITGEIQDVILQPPTSQLPNPHPPTYYLARRKNFPAGTYGSFFKNPPGDFAGRLLEEAGAKDLKVGGAYVWREHANVIVRGEGATASDVLALARLMRNRVLFRFGIALEPEVCGIAF